jgi:hypothetical protein
MVARLHTHLRGLATAIHEISGLEPTTITFALTIFVLCVRGVLGGASQPTVINLKLPRELSWRTSSLSAF